MSKSDMKRENEKRFRGKLNRKHWRDYRLRELEKQLEFAESRCGTLKQQLDYIKVLYGCGRPYTQEAEETSESYDKVDNSRLSTVIRHSSYDDLSRWNKVEENGSGENVEKCFLSEAVSYTNTTRGSSNSSNKPISSKSSFEKKEVIIHDGRKESSEHKNHMKLMKGKRKKNSSTSRHKLKSKGPKAKLNNVVCQTVWPMWQDPVVEIYKNYAANIESESAADICYKSKRQKLENVKSEQSKTNVMCINNGKVKKSIDSNEQLVPATKLKAFTSFKSLEKIPIVKEEGVQTETLAENEFNCNPRCDRNDSTDGLPKPLPNSGKLDSFFYDPEPIKSYCQPTISSKKKRVERNFLTSLNNFNLKNIPFIAATSTSPSHNIGVNIQQVLSIMKKRQPNANNDIIPILSDHGSGSVNGQLQTNSRVAMSESPDGDANQGEYDVILTVADSKKRLEVTKSTTSARKITSKGSFKPMPKDEVTDNGENPDWMCKVHKLKKVLVFLHEDFTSLSQKYKRLQKKLSKRNINKHDAKGELAEIERDLEKKEEEITIVIGLYKEVLHLRDEVKKYQEKYNFAISERTLMMDGIKQSNSTHTQMSTLLRKIQQFQDQLKR